MVRLNADVVVVVHDAGRTCPHERQQDHPYRASERD
jgi:hypothetical protein